MTEVVQQNSTDPTDNGHLFAGERITLDELATHLSAVRVWLRQLAVAAERPAVPVELGKLCDELDRMAEDVGDRAAELAKVDAVIQDGRPLPRTMFGGNEPWGAAAHGADPDKAKYGKRLSTVLSFHQILRLAYDEMPWRADQAEPGISYLEGLEGLPGLDRWESPRAARRRAQEREQRIQAQTRQEVCPTCHAEPGGECRTRTGRLAELDHKPRRQKAVATIDAADADAAA
jgi:hypothetical protein